MVFKLIGMMIFKCMEIIARWSTGLAAKLNPSQGIAFRVWSVKDDEFKILLGLLDTGTKRNWVRRDQFERLGATPISFTEVVYFEDFQGGRWAVESQVKLQFQRVGSHRMREEWFLVAENSPFNMMLASEFLYPEGVHCNEPALAAKENTKQAKRWYTAVTLCVDFLAYME